MKKTAQFAFYTGLLLLAINIFGMFKTMRNPAVYSEEKTIRNRLNDISIEYPGILDMLKRKDLESNVDFAVRINKVVNDGFIHYWRDQGIEKYHLRVPVWENWILFAASYISPGKYKKYEFSNYKKNLERGVGLCSTHSTIVKGVLLDNGIKAELMDVGGHHVVVRAELDSMDTYILDPDFGVVVPFDTAAISANPELVREPYGRLAELYYPDAKDPYTTDYLVKIFGDRKYIYTLNSGFEDFTYWAKWLIPPLLMSSFLLTLVRKK
jgi:hypothetical protein